VPPSPQPAAQPPAEAVATGAVTASAPVSSAPPTGPIVLTATRLGQPSRPPVQTEAVAGGSDNAFVF
jgi:hypothetical protein